MNRDYNSIRAEVSDKLLELTSHIFEDGVLDRFLTDLAEYARSNVNFSNMVVLLLDENKQRVSIQLEADGEQAEVCHDHFPLEAFKRRPVFKTLLEEECIVLSKTQFNSIYEIDNFVKVPGMAQISLPLKMNKGMSGALVFSNKDIEEFSELDIWVAESIAKSLSIVYRSKMQESKIYQLANFDSLTGLANRAHFYHQLDNLDYQSFPVNALLFIDMDKFKPINDTYGHDVGDSFLKLVAERIKEQLRDYDTAGRLGGDEFAVLVRNISEDHDAEKIAQRLVDTFSGKVKVGDIEVDTGVSVGVVSFCDNADIQLVAKLADEAMYEAKRTGRNKYQMKELIV